ncbi:bifunctional oligoribonuclease/PAP phosphatase NrnA [Maribacter algicola]|uniref:Bifunctional oligoribonuclease/PAP phosphatase NrnA n=1 Tax=Maribacter algicola TaxID=2498892 RepID=A0A3R8Q3C4_9FLAO|nr:bifunctional oligoribonuclease/PAP phosphatase NrnA [Maribacter algicola]RRQ48917.1 bifunctional oligoribonuclease/PAP phosphatase NrnA [Maribacter algicola]
MNFEQVAALKNLLSSPKRIAIIPHKNPDGDAIGSTLALSKYLSKKGHNTQVLAPNDFPKFLKWMPGADQILNYERHNAETKKFIAEADVIFTLDFNDFGRVGHMAECLENAKAKFVMVDHHQQPSGYAVITYSDINMSSTCEMVYTLIDAMGDRDLIDQDIANCIYTGIMTDTGSFKFRATTSQTHRIVAELMDKGADNTAIHQRVYDTNSPSRLHLLGCALKNMVILEEFNTAYITLTQEELDRYDYEKGDTEGFVNYGLTLDKIRFAVIFIENKEEGIFKISFRSVGDFSVNEFARNYFDGGGHTNAAGGKSEKSLEETIDYFVSLLPKYKKALTA